MQPSLPHLAMIALLVAGPAFSQATPAPDFHALFEESCLECHGHSGPFIREYVTLENGDLIGSDGQAIGPFLDKHRGGMPAGVKTIFMENFRNQIVSGGLFETNCLICHDSAKDFARLKLILRDDRLFGRYTDREVMPFLMTHGRLTPEEAGKMVVTLKAFLPSNP